MSEKVKFKDITINLDKRRKPLNGRDREKISNQKLYPYCGANSIMDYVDEYLFDEEILCVAEDGGKWGKNEKCSYIMNEKCWVNNHAHVIKVKENVDIRYLKYWLNYTNLDPYISGAIVRKLTQKELNELELVLPIKEEQQQISDTLDKIQNSIEVKQKQGAELNELIKSQFVEMFGNVENSKYMTEKLNDLVTIKHGYAFKGEYFSDIDNGIVLLTPGNFSIGGGFQEDKCRFFTGEYDKNWVLSEGDLIVTMTDLSKKMDTLGYGAIIPKSDRVYLHNQRIGLFQNIDNRLNKVYIEYFMRTSYYRSKIIASATGSTVHHSSPSRILSIEIPIPPIELQNQFAEFVKQVDKQKFEIENSLKEMQELYESLMDKYFG